MMAWPGQVEWAGRCRPIVVAQQEQLDVFRRVVRPSRASQRRSCSQLTATFGPCSGRSGMPLHIESAYVWLSDGCKCTVDRCRGAESAVEAISEACWRDRGAGAALLVAVAPVAVAAPGPSVDLDPTSGPPGTRVTVTGNGWPPGHRLAVAFPDRGFWGPGSVTVNPDGTFTYSFAWPSPAEPGDHQVAVIDNTGPVDGPAYPIFTVTPGQPPPASTAPSVSVDRTYVADAKWTEVAQLKRGDLVRYQIVVSASGGATIEARMRVADQDGHVIFDGHGNLPVTPKAGSVYFQSTIPGDAAAGNYTETATVKYNGATTTQTNSLRLSLRTAPRKFCSSRRCS